MTQSATWEEMTQAKERWVLRPLVCSRVRKAVGELGRLGPSERSDWRRYIRGQTGKEMSQNGAVMGEEHVEPC